MSADTKETEATEGEAPPKKKLAGKQLILFIVLPAILLLGGGGAAAYFLVFAKKPAAEAGAHGAEKGHEKEKGHKKDKKKESGGHGGSGGGEGNGTGMALTEGPNGEAFLTLPDLVVNIAAQNGRPTYLKLRLTLQVADAEAAEAMQPALPRIMDQYTGFLRELRMEDIQGSAGYARLQLELLRRVNLAVAPAQVDAVLIQEMLVQ